MFEQPVTEKQCSRCLQCKSTMAFRFRTSSMGYHAMCRQCEGDAKKEKGARPARPQRWPEADRAIVRAYYPEGGADACQPHLPHHNLNAIRGIANKMEVKYVGPRQCGSRPLSHDDVPLPAPYDYAPEDRAWMTTRVPVYARPQELGARPSVLGAVVGVTYG